YDRAVENIHERWDENQGHHWCHTISNAMIVATGLLYGELDYARSICRAVQPCFDTDCNGATVGSIVGAVLGAEALPEQWTAPVNDTLLTSLAGYNRVRISEMADQTVALVRKLRG
ncbi:MAG TPA: ADP-ribosylglycohydrolase family protein, partial [Phycisphaerae bacterium]|nr:ADP-ribosylglycohydrolase family protein [Phycisphaerae bacterium]